MRDLDSICDLFRPPLFRVVAFTVLDGTGMRMRGLGRGRSGSNTNNNVANGRPWW